MIKDNILKKLEIISKKIVLFLFALFVGFLALSSIFFSVVDFQAERNDVVLDWFWLNILVMAFVVWLGVYIKKNKQKFNAFKVIATPQCMTILTILNTAVLAWWVFATQFEPTIDQFYILDVAANMMKKDYSDWYPGFNFYMFDYPFQNGIVLFYYFISQIIGPKRYVILQLINIPFLLLGIFAVYRICTRIWKDRGRQNSLVYIVMPLWIPFSLYVTFIYGTIVGFAFATLGIMFIYDYFEKRKWYYALFSGIFMGIGVVLKSNYTIFMIALVIMIVLDYIKTQKKEDFIAIYFVVALFVVFTKGTNVLTEYITGVDTPDGIPKVAWIAMGITGNETYGWWSGYTLFVFNKNDYNYEAAKAEAIAKIAVRLKDFASNPLSMCKFYLMKIWTIWINPLFQGITIQNDRPTAIQLNKFVVDLLNTSSLLHSSFRHIMDLVQSLIYTGAFFFSVSRWKKCTLYELIFAILFIGGFLFELMWESKCQYTIFFFYLLIPYAIVGWNECVNWFVKRMLSK